MQNGHVLAFPATRAAFAQAFSDFRRALDGYSLPRQARYRCELVFEEVVTNVIRYGHRDEQAHVQISLDSQSDAFVMRFEDDGVPFDPTTPTDPQKGRSARTDGGGHGLRLVQTAAQALEYERTLEHRNRVTVTIATR